MSLNAKDAPGTVSRTPPLGQGTYPARLVLVVDLGMQPQRPYKGQDKPPANKILLTYEFVDEFMLDEDGQEMADKPRWLSEEMVLYNLEAEKAKSTLRYNVFDPNNIHKGDFGNLVNTPCNITVVHNPKSSGGGVWENIAGVSEMRIKDMKKCPPLVNDPLVLDLDEPDMNVFEALPNWIKKKIVSNLEFKGSKLEGLLKEEQVPFPDTELSSEAVETPY